MNLPMIARLARKLALLLLAGGPALLLAACGDGEDAAPPTVEHISDPLMDAALADTILVDPDMVARNSANTAISLGAQDGAIPLPDSGTDAARAAREDAMDMVGGSNAMRRAPQPERVDGELPAAARLSVAARAASAGNGNADCAAIAQFSAVWAARMPASFPVYPRGAVHEAAGTDEQGCKLRVVNFTTPVSIGDVMDFYFTQASKAGFETQRVLQDGEDILGGTSDGSSFMVFARTGAFGMTSVDIVTTGN